MITPREPPDEARVPIEPHLAACAYGPLATRRKRLAVACRCMGQFLGLAPHKSLRTLVEVGWRYVAHTLPLTALESPLRRAEEFAEESANRAESVMSIFEGLRAGNALADAREARTVTGAIRWALGMPGGVVPPVPSQWQALRDILAIDAAPPVCLPTWRTGDVLTLARLVRDSGQSERFAQRGCKADESLPSEAATQTKRGASVEGRREPKPSELLPILADALQDAGCDDGRILDHCRRAEVHTPGCWVPDLILDAD